MHEQKPYGGISYFALLFSAPVFDLAACYGIQETVNNLFRGGELPDCMRCTRIREDAFELVETLMNVINPSNYGSAMETIINICGWDF